MEIKQFYDEQLAHASYAILSEGEIALVDPSRDTKEYLDFASEKNAKIIAVLETHPHADFASSHAEIARKTGAKIYVGELVGVFYDHVAINDGDEIKLGKISIKAIHTPGHSPDSFSFIVKDENGNESAIATGDTLFVGDVGRPDLREGAGNINMSREDLAKEMFKTLREKFVQLPDNTLVYPAHGAGSLCGKALKDVRFSTMGEERKQNYALQIDDEDTFVNTLLEDQPYIPKYFPYCVELNRKGAPDLEESLKAVPQVENVEQGYTVIDTRTPEEYESGHIQGAINIPDCKSFETWLGSIVSPDEKFYLVGSDEKQIDKMLRRAAKIGYELLAKGTLINPTDASFTAPTLESEHVNFDDYLILDVRNENEAKEKTFEKSVNIPLNRLRESIDELNADKPVLVHCAGGQRSAIGRSILNGKLNVEVYNLGEKVKQFAK